MRLGVSQSSPGVRVRWGGPTLASLRSTPFSDDDILRILRAGEAGLKVADVCAAENLPAKTYYQWKVKYGDLEPEEMKRRRRRERSYRRAGVGVLVLVVLAVAYSFIADTPAPNQPRASANRPPASPGPPVALQPPPVPARPVAAPLVAAKPQEMAAADVKAIDPAGYAIQVAAVRELGDARQLVERLAATGHNAYITRTTAGQRDMYRVRIGPFESREQADAALDRLALEGHRGAWIAR